MKVSALTLYQFKVTRASLHYWFAPWLGLIFVATQNERVRFFIGDVNQKQFRLQQIRLWAIRKEFRLLQNGSIFIMQKVIRSSDWDKSLKLQFSLPAGYRTASVIIALTDGELHEDLFYYAEREVRELKGGLNGPHKLKPDDTCEMRDERDQTPPSILYITTLIIFVWSGKKWGQSVCKIYTSEPGRSPHICTGIWRFICSWERLGTTGEGIQKPDALISFEWPLIHVDHRGWSGAEVPSSRICFSWKPAAGCPMLSFSVNTKSTAISTWKKK